MMCVNVRLKEDCIVEEKESFYVVLDTPSYVDERIKIYSPKTEIVITDNDSTNLHF